MTLKPPTRTFPKLVMKEWPKGYIRVYTDRELSDFTRVLEGVQTKSQKEGLPSNED